ncbi:MAG TPA: glycoside hydrolase family 65 protein [Clostridiaceae bacterium]|nr:glycoside hydrolase family 65 protein [Clostridiaceae bacterium]
MNLFHFLSAPSWIIQEEKGIENLNKYETIFALSNGSLGVRGNLEEMPKQSITGTFLGGVFDRDVAWEWDMVNLPNFLEIDLRLCGKRISIEEQEALKHTRMLDMRKGILYRCSKFKTEQGQVIKWESIRVVSIIYPNLCFERHCFTLENSDGMLQVSHILDSSVKTLDGWQQLNLKHLQVFDNNHKDDILYSCSKLIEARHPIGAATLMKCSKSGVSNFEIGDDTIRRIMDFDLKQGEVLVCDRFSTVQVRFDKDYDMNSLRDELVEYLKDKSSKGFDILLEEQCRKMNAIWENSDIIFEGDDALQKQVRYSLFHLIQAGPRHNEKASIGAKGLTGYRYTGHIFWDTEMFMLPFYVFTDPLTAKNILLYRYHMLPGARRNAATYYQKGARYPYRSAGTGDEAITIFCPGGWVKNAHPFYRVEKWWFAENEIHISSAIAYGIMLYFKVSNDKEFMQSYGLEMLCEISRFYISYMEWNSAKKQYEILDVMGPDEYHPRTNNNTYTNYMAYYTIKWTLEQLSSFSKSNPDAVERLKEKISLTETEVNEWERRSNLMYLPVPNEKGIIPQCDGFLELKDFDKGDQEIIVDDDAPFVENAIGEPVAKEKRSEFQCVKQCDLVLLFCLMPDLFERDIVLKNFDYYERRTYHMSSLSPNTASIIALRLDKGENAYKYLNLSSIIDLHDIQGNTKNGIHSAAAGGTWMASAYGFGGLTLNKNFELEFAPKLPDKWTLMNYKIFWHGSRIDVKYDGKELRLKLDWGDPVQFVCNGKAYTLTDTLNIPYTHITKVK